MCKASNQETTKTEINEHWKAYLAHGEWVQTGCITSVNFDGQNLQVLLDRCLFLSDALFFLSSVQTSKATESTSWALGLEETLCEPGSAFPCVLMPCSVWIKQTEGWLDWNLHALRPRIHQAENSTPPFNFRNDSHRFGKQIEYRFSGLNWRTLK